MTIRPGGVYGSKTPTDMLKEARAGEAVVIAATVAPSYALFDGEGIFGALARTLDGGVSGFENAGSPFVGHGRSSTTGAGTSLFNWAGMSSHASDSQVNNPTSVAEFAEWHGQNMLAFGVNIREGETTNHFSTVLNLSKDLSWWTKTTGNTDDSVNLNVYHVIGQYGGESANLVSFRAGSRRNASGFTHTGSTADINGEITAATRIHRVSYTTSNISAFAGVECRMCSFSEIPTGLDARDMRGKVFHMGQQALRRAAQAGNSIPWLLLFSGGQRYSLIAANLDSAAKRRSAQLHADEMHANLRSRGDTRPVYVIFYVMEDANTMSHLTVSGTQTQYLDEVMSLMDNLKLTGEAFASIDGWAIMHQGQPPQLTAGNANRTAAYEAYRGFNASNANDIKASHNYQYLDPMVYTDPGNAWTSGFTLWKNEGDTTVHFTAAGHRLMTNEAVLASLEFGASGGHRSRARYNRAR